MVLNTLELMDVWATLSLSRARARNSSWAQQCCVDGALELLPMDLDFRELIGNSVHNAQLSAHCLPHMMAEKEKF